MTTRVVFFIADGFQGLDLFGPLDAFYEANSWQPDAYECLTLGLQQGPVLTSSKQQVIAELALAEFAQSDELALDYLVICGGAGMRTLSLDQQAQQQLTALAQRSKRLISICTGSFVLAQLFPKQPKNLTTHWRHCQELVDAHQHHAVDANPLFIEDNNVWSSAGVLAGVDLALEIIRQDHGNTIAANVAKELVVYIQRKGGQNQFSDALQVQTADCQRLQPLLQWLMNNLDRTISVARMADEAAMSERQLNRLFHAHLHKSPAKYLNELRLNRARELLSDANRSLNDIASAVGFTHYDSFRRAFERHFGVAPSHFQS